MSLTEAEVGSNHLVKLLYPDEMMLAISYYANDISMITEARFGIFLIRL